MVVGIVIIVLISVIGVALLTMTDKDWSEVPPDSHAGGCKSCDEPNCGGRVDEVKIPKQ